MTERAVTSVAVCGGGLAAAMCALALRKGLDEAVTVTLVGPKNPPMDDNLYGHILPPSAYGFHLGLGITEPEFLLSTASTFAYGTAMMGWVGRSWVQAFAQPLPIWDGVPMARLVALHDGTSLQDVLVAAQATRRGVFAHPPEDAANPLSRAEYGYAFAPEQLARFYAHHGVLAGVRKVEAEVERVDRDSDTVRSVRLSNGSILDADMFIDAGGPDSAFGNDVQTVRKLHAVVSHDPAAKPGPPACVVSANDMGWTSEVLLQNGARRVTVSPTASEQSLPLELGSTDTPWRANTVAIGRAAARLEPFTTAPVKLLLRDVERLLQLFPVSTDTTIEAREYNRAFRNDRDHAELFNAAHFAANALPDTPYWQEREQPPKLDRKLEQYDSRGLLVSYDHEPFNNEDWFILHDGMGRTPRRRDLLASLVPETKTDRQIHELASSITALVAKMPPHPVYLGKFLSYLRRKYA